MNTLQQIRFILKPLVFAACLLPFGWAVLAAFGVAGDLGANPVEGLLDHFGNWAIRFIMLALAVTPLRRLSGWNWLSRFRRMLGLFAFFYVLMHFLTWLVLDQGLLLSAIVEDIAKRPFITIGFAALLLLSAMALTSTAGMRRRLGRRWQQLHNSVYVVGVLAVWHYWWQVKADIREPLIYAVILTFLLGFRIWDWRQQARRKRTMQRTPSAARTAKGDPASARN